MRRRPSFLLLVLPLSLLATNTWADGVTSRESVLRPCGGSFAGAYIGAGLGYGRQRTEITNETAGASGPTFKDDDGSVTFAGYTGYNWQGCDGLVLGVETDFNYLHTSPTVSENATTSLESRLDWFGTLRGRAGYVVHDDLLLYGTGGLAYGRVDHTFNDPPFGPGGPPPPPPPTLNNPPPSLFEQSNKDSKVGWTIGGGAEYLPDAHWLLRAEALYVDLGSETHDYVACAGCRASLNWDDQFWVARLGLAYKFGETELVAP